MTLINFEDLGQRAPEAVKIQFGALMLVLSSIEYFLEQCLILVIIEKQFDASNTGHLILENYVKQQNFNQKIELIKKYNLFTEDLRNDLSEVRVRRNAFAHGIVTLENGNFFIGTFKKSCREDFTEENLTNFKKFAERVRDQLLSEFQKKGFTFVVSRE